MCSNFFYKFVFVLYKFTKNKMQTRFWYTTFSYIIISQIKSPEVFHLTPLYNAIRNPTFSILTVFQNVIMLEIIRCFQIQHILYSQPYWDYCF